MDFIGCCFASLRSRLLAPRSSHDWLVLQFPVAESTSVFVFADVIADTFSGIVRNFDTILSFAIRKFALIGSANRIRLLQIILFDSRYHFISIYNGSFFAIKLSQEKVTSNEENTNDACFKHSAVTVETFMA